MKDKETKEKFEQFYFENEQILNSRGDVGLTREKYLEFVFQIEQEAERRGEKRYEISLSEKADKPYIVIDDMKQGGKTIFAGTLEHIQINKLLEEDNGKQNAR